MPSKEASALQAAVKAQAAALAKPRIVEPPTVEPDAGTRANGGA